MRLDRRSNGRSKSARYTEMTSHSGQPSGVSTGSQPSAEYDLRRLSCATQRATAPTSIAAVKNGIWCKSSARGGALNATQCAFRIGLTGAVKCPAGIAPRGTGPAAWVCPRVCRPTNAIVTTGVDQACKREFECDGTDGAKRFSMRENGAALQRQAWRSRSARGQRPAVRGGCAVDRACWGALGLICPPSSATGRASSSASGRG